MRLRALISTVTGNVKASMSLRCPNCGQPWKAQASTCASCGATFISSRAWRRERALAERNDVLNGLALAALACGLLALVFLLMGRGHALLYALSPWLAVPALLAGALALLLAWLREAAARNLTAPLIAAAGAVLALAALLGRWLA
jgi:ribosomal protein L37E